MKLLVGKKTYIAAAGMAALALLGFWYQVLSGPGAAFLIFMALGFFGIGDKIDRAAVAKDVVAMAEASKAHDEIRVKAAAYDLLANLAAGTPLAPLLQAETAVGVSAGAEKK
jgi:hypothetical protein